MGRKLDSYVNKYGLEDGPKKLTLLQKKSNICSQMEKFEKKRRRRRPNDPGPENDGQ